MPSRFDTFLRHSQAVLFSAAAASLIVSGVIYFAWRRDNRVLRRQAQEAARGARTTADAIVALNRWVYQDGGFAKNHGYYLLRQLGPTPLQILHSGGDCADKSRLLSAMLYQVGIPSSLVMIYPCRDCEPIHTVVEARYDQGRMVVDPVWGIEYPAGNGRYYGLRELAWSALGRSWVSHLKAQSSASAKIAAMPPREATFDYATGLNWDKNRITRVASAILQRMHLEVAFLPRPRILEDPQLALWVSLLALATPLFALGMAVGAWRAARRRSVS